jgi:hypothetical protein
MTVSPVQGRWILAACVVLVVAVAMVIAVGVIPPVRVANAPDISPKDAVPAFRVAVGLHLLAGLVLLLITTLSKGRSRTSASGLVVTGIVVLLLGFVIGDAALAFLEAEPPMRAVTTLLFVCVAADVLAGALTVTTALLRPKVMS